MATRMQKIKDVMTPDRLRALKALAPSKPDGFLEKALELPSDATTKDILAVTASLQGGSISLTQKAKNFAFATAKHIAAGSPTCSDEEIGRRHDICLGCEFFKANSCSKCGCPISRDRKFISKLAWADQSCPVGKWGPAA